MEINDDFAEQAEVSKKLLERAGLEFLEKRHSEMFERSKFKTFITKFGFANDHCIHWSQRKSGFPRENTSPVLGKPMAWYPMKTAKSVSEIKKTYLSTDPKLISIAKSLDIEIIERPDYLATDQHLEIMLFNMVIRNL